MPLLISVKATKAILFEPDCPSGKEQSDKSSVHRDDNDKPGLHIYGTNCFSNY
jgi:hypothetical protein